MPHSFFAEMGIELLFRGVCYGSGRLLLFLLAIPVQVEAFSRQKIRRYRDCDSFTYQRAGIRYLYTDSVVLLGLMFWLVLALIAGMLWWWQAQTSG